MSTKMPIAGQPWGAPLKGQPGYGIIQNPPFDSRILNIPMRQVVIGAANYASGSGASDSKLYRGAMVTRQPRDGVQYKVNFLYNPSTISESRSLDMNNQPLPDYARVPGDTGDYKTPLNTTVSFSLLFDRTYELWDSKYRGTDPGTYGVQVDTNAFYNMVGINQKQVVSGPVAGGGQLNKITQGTMSAVPLDLYFGYNAPGGLKYFGIISDMGVTYSHFSQQMVPMRCAVDIGFTIFADQANSN